MSEVEKLVVKLMICKISVNKVAKMLKICYNVIINDKTLHILMEAKNGSLR